MRLPRGLPYLCKLREIMEPMSALFERRCRRHTARSKLAELRRWIKRFTWVGNPLHELCSANLVKALTFLDDTLSPASSHTVKRGHWRRHKRQKSVYGSHRKNRLIVPIALDMIREASAISDSKFHSPCMMLARRHMTQNPCYSLRSLQVLPAGAPTRASVLLD